MRCHIVHLAVIPGVEPALQVLLVLGQVQSRDPDLLKAELAPQCLDRLGKVCQPGFR